MRHSGKRFATMSDAATTGSTTSTNSLCCVESIRERFSLIVFGVQPNCNREPPGAGGGYFGSLTALTRVRTLLQLALP